MRSGRSVGSGRGWNWSSASSTVGPWYQGMCRLRSAMLSPSRAEIGMKQVGSTPSSRQIGPVLLGDLAEALGAVADQVHLVDQHRHLADAEQVQQIAVPARLLLHALVGVDQQQRRLARWRRR